MEVIMMSANLNSSVFERPPHKHGGAVWHKLNSERANICEELLKETAPVGESLALDSMSNDVMSTANWHRELLQLRLRKVDEALDRLMSGSYGECSRCGKWIEDTKLEFDPAMAFCLTCWDRIQTKH
jgi:RNA polymerase-binding transcription factor DksA